MQRMEQRNLKVLLQRRGMNLASLADLLGVTRGTVTRWGQGRLPPERAIEIEKATDGSISRSDLRPDLWPRDAAA
jgi:DNA-binding transcriptional regulator YdaS (Cro superfamily)